MQTLSAKYGFERLIDLARAEPVAVEKHGRPVVVVMAVEEYEKLAGDPAGRRPGRRRRWGAQTHR